MQQNKIQLHFFLNGTKSLFVYLCMIPFFISCQDKEPWEKTPRNANRYCVRNNTNQNLVISTEFKQRKQLQNEIIKPGKLLQIASSIGGVDVSVIYPGIITKIIISKDNGDIITQECELRRELAVAQCDIVGTIFDPAAYRTGGKRELIYDINEDLFNQ